MERKCYQDLYNEKKIWEVTKISHGYYLKQYICGKQFGKGKRATLKEIKGIGILEMKEVQ